MLGHTECALKIFDSASLPSTSNVRPPPEVGENVCFCHSDHWKYYLICISLTTSRVDICICVLFALAVYFLKTACSYTLYIFLIELLIFFLWDLCKLIVQCTSFYPSLSFVFLLHLWYICLSLLIFEFFLVFKDLFIFREGERNINVWISFRYQTISKISFLDGERNINVWLLLPHIPTWGPGPQPMHVP